MKTQAMTWLVAGVIAAGLNASYHDGGMQWAHQIVDRVEHNSAAVLALASGRADQFLEEARLMTARNDGPSCPWARAFERAETRAAKTETVLNRFEVISSQSEVKLARIEANRARIEAQLARVRVPRVALNSVLFQNTVACPRVRVVVPRIPNIRIPAVPDIHIQTPGSDPI